MLLLSLYFVHAQVVAIKRQIVGLFLISCSWCDDGMDISCFEFGSNISQCGLLKIKDSVSNLPENDVL